jgi:hypothetical protein
MLNITKIVFHRQITALISVKCENSNVKKKPVGVISSTGFDHCIL